MRHPDPLLHRVCKWREHHEALGATYASNESNHHHTSESTVVDCKDDSGVDHLTGAVS